MSQILGILIALGSLWMSIKILGVNPLTYWDTVAFLCVFVLSYGTTLITMPISFIFMLPVYYMQAFIPLPYKLGDVVVSLQRMADKTRQAGLPALTSEIPVAVDEYTKRALKLMVAGTDSHVIKSIMQAELHGMEMRHKTIIQTFEGWGGFMPTCGMIATIMGIIEAMGKMEDVAYLGHAIGIALLGTLYGVVGANVLMLPIAARLKRKHEEEVMMKTAIMEGLLAIQAGETSNIVGLRAKAICSEAQRAAIEGGKGLSKKKGEKHIELTTYMNALDQEKALAFLAEVKQATEAKEIGIDDVKQLLAQLINEADDKILMRDFANEFMKLKSTKKLPKGSKMKRRKGGKPGVKAAKKAKKKAEDEE